LLGKTPHQDMVEEIAQRDLGFAYPDTILLPR
jgi:cell division protein FtsB